MRAQPRLLQMVINYWDLNTEAFNLYGMPLKVGVEDICFNTGLSYQGIKVFNIKAHRVSGGMSIDEYVTLPTLRKWEFKSPSI